MASPKTNAKEPISLDMILVCKKQELAVSSISEDDMEKALSRKIKQVENGSNPISKSDRFNIRASLLLATASKLSLSSEGFKRLLKEGQNLDDVS